MSYVVSLFGYVPPARADGTPWSSAQIEEGATRSGPWTTIDTLVLAPLDADPARPSPRDFTTSQATLDIGWYRLTFFDAAGGQSVPSDPERNVASDATLPPAPEDIRNESPLLRGKFPIPATDPFAPADLRNLVYQATSLVQAITFRLIDPTFGDLAPEGYSSEAVPDGLAPVAIQAIARVAERIYVTTEPDFAEQVATGRRLRGFNAGPYSESYFAPGEFARRGAQQGRPAMDPDDAVDIALWTLATEDARDYFVWRSTGVAPPMGVATAFDYRRLSRGYTAGSVGFPYDGYGRGGPDGY